MHIRHRLHLVHRYADAPHSYGGIALLVRRRLFRAARSTRGVGRRNKYSHTDVLGLSKDRKYESWTSMWPPFLLFKTLKLFILGNHEEFFKTTYTVGKLLTRSTRFTCFCTAQTSIFPKKSSNVFRIFRQLVFFFAIFIYCSK